MGEAQDLMREINHLETIVKGLKGKLVAIQATCQHDFAGDLYNPIIEKGYTIPSRTPRNYDDIMDAQGVHVPDKTIDQWTRVCKLCSKVESTSESTVTTTSTKTPRFK